MQRTIRATSIVLSIALITLFAAACTGQIDSTTFYCNHINVTYTSISTTSVDATVSANGTVIASINNISVQSGTFTVSGSYPDQKAGTVLTLNVSNGMSASGACTPNVSWFNPGDARVDPKAGDRLAVYCDGTTNSVIVYGIKDDSTGFYQGKFSFKDLLAAGKNGLSIDNGSNGVISASSDSSGNLWIAWNGGQYGANGQPDRGFAKGLTCGFATNQS